MLLSDELNQDPGDGNLNLRAYVASIVGPRRVVHGQRIVKRVPVTGSILLLKSTATGRQATYYEVWMPRGYPTTIPGPMGPIAVSLGVTFGFTSENGGGPENSYAVPLTPVSGLTSGAGVGFVGASQIFRHSGVLLEDEALYVAALADSLGAPLTSPIAVVVSSVVF